MAGGRNYSENTTALVLVGDRQQNLIDLKFVNPVNTAAPSLGTTAQCFAESSPAKLAMHDHRQSKPTQNSKFTFLLTITLENFPDHRHHDQLLANCCNHTPLPCFHQIPAKTCHISTRQLGDLVSDPPSQLCTTRCTAHSRTRQSSETVVRPFAWH